MKLMIQVHNVELTEWLEQYVDKKIGKLGRYLPDIDEAFVELREEKTRSAADRAVAQVTIRNPRTILRAEERSGDMFASIDAVTDKLERRIERYKGKRAPNNKRSVAHANTVVEAVTAPSEEAEPDTGNLVRVKQFEMQSMDPDEAIEQMELLGHDFYVFQNSGTGTVNVVYRRRDSNFGLLQPELG